MIIVTGGLGFIGSALVKELNDRGRRDIFIIDRFRDENKWFNVRDLKFEDVIDPDFYLEAEFMPYLEEVDQVFHLGACNTTTEKDMDFLWRNNVNFSKSVFTLATEYNQKLVYASSASTYGAGENGYDDNPELLAQLKPLHQYGYSKQVFDEWVLNAQEEPLHWYGLKFFNVYGPHEYHKTQMPSVALKCYEQIANDGKVRLFKSYREGIADGEQQRDFIYVKDVAKAMVELMDIEDPSASGIYNLGSGQARSFNDLAKAAFAATGKPENIEYVEMPDSLINQYQYFTEANMQRFKKILPQFEFTSLEDGVKDYYDNYLGQDHPYMGQY